MRKKEYITIIISLICILVAFLSIVRSNRVDRIVKIMNEYDNVNKIVIKTSTNNISITDQEKLKYYKTNLEPDSILENQKKDINNSLDKKVLEIEFFVNDKVLFTEEIYLLNDDTQATDYFMINDSKYIAKVHNFYRELHIQDNAIFDDILIID